jgi:hypothetical protein
MGKNEIIVRVGAEGGDVTLYGVRDGRRWLFSREVIDQTPLMIDESAIEHSSETVTTWRRALKLLDKYPWHHLYPLEVHPEFRERVMAEVIKRFEAENNIDPYRLPDWEQVCGRPRD